MKELIHSPFIKSFRVIVAGKNGNCYKNAIFVHFAHEYVTISPLDATDVVPPFLTILERMKIMKITWNNKSEIRFADLVRQMRNAQKTYFKTRTKESLEQAKLLEKQVDDVIEGVSNCGLFRNVK